MLFDMVQSAYGKDDRKGGTRTSITCISGTPGTGKSSVAVELAKRGFRAIEVEAYSRERGVYSYISNGETLVIDVEELADSLRHFLRGDPDIFLVGHLSHNVSEADAVVVLRTHPDSLRKRLKAKGWPAAKIEENVEAEAMGICLGDALELHGDRVSEIDTTSCSLRETVKMVLGIHRGCVKYPPQSRDWLLEHILKSARP